MYYLFYKFSFQAPKKLLHLLDMSTNEDILLRVVTLLANLTQCVRKLKIDPILDLPLEDKAPSPDTMYEYFSSIITVLIYLFRVHVITVKITKL